MHQNYSSYGQATTRYNKDNKPQDDNTRSKRKRDVEISDHRRISDNDNNATIADGNLFGEESHSQEEDTLAIWIPPWLLMMMIPVRWRVKI